MRALRKIIVNRIAGHPAGDPLFLFESTQNGVKFVEMAAQFHTAHRDYRAIENSGSPACSFNTGVRSTIDYYGLLDGWLFGCINAFCFPQNRSVSTFCTSVNLRALEGSLVCAISTQSRTASYA